MNTNDPKRPRSLPLCPAWGLQVPLSYQRPGYRQIGVDAFCRVGIDEPLAWGANYLDIYPSNKESAFPDAEDYQHKMWAQYTFRERPDHDQEERWTTATFRRANRYAHQHGFLVAWFLHHKFPFAIEAEWWGILRSVHRELAETVCDVAADGWGAHVDGLGSEGHSVPPERIPDLIWDEQPGLFTREASYVYDYAAPHHIRSYAFHLSDGRDYYYGGARWNKPAYPVEVYEGKPLQLRYGNEFVGFQAEARDLTCDDPGWGSFSGLAGPDAIVEQLGNLYRARLIGGHRAATTATWFINEPLISPRMRRYAFGVAQDPVRAAVAGDLFTTAADGPFPRVPHPRGTHFIQNNYFRAYVRNNGRIELHADICGRGNYTDYLECTRRLVADELLLVDHRHTAPAECTVECLEEAGAVAVLRMRVRYNVAETVEILDEYTLRLIADQPVLRIAVQRRTRGVETVATRLGLEPTTPAAELAAGQWFQARGRFDAPPVRVRLQVSGPGAEDWTLRPGPACTLMEQRAAAETLFELQFQLGDTPETVPDVRRVELDRPIPNPAGWDGACAVLIPAAATRPYWVQEDGWWCVRGAQPSRQHPGMDYLKVYLAPNEDVQIRAAGLLEQGLGPGWGCQYVLRFRDVTATEHAVHGTVRVEDVAPILFAPRLRLPWTVGAVQLNGRAWHYFDGEHVFLPNRRGEVRVDAIRGRPATPHLTGTFAVVEATDWDGAALHCRTALPPWVREVPPGYRFRGLCRFRDLDLTGVEGAELARAGRSEDGTGWVVVRFEPGTFQLHFRAAARPAAT